MVERSAIEQGKGQGSGKTCTTLKKEKGLVSSTWEIDKSYRGKKGKREKGHTYKVNPPAKKTTPSPRGGREGRSAATLHRMKPNVRLSQGEKVRDIKGGKTSIGKNDCRSGKRGESLHSGRERRGVSTGRKGQRALCVLWKP